FFFSSRRRHTSFSRDWSSDVCSSDLSGNALDNLMIGGSYDDTMDGGAGRDILVGGIGADTLIGGPGSDMFVYNSIAEKGDVIKEIGRASCREGVERPGGAVWPSE